jgi:carboxyl-terminal processing protease
LKQESQFQLSVNLPGCLRKKSPSWIIKIQMRIKMIRFVKYTLISLILISSSAFAATKKDEKDDFKNKDNQFYYKRFQEVFEKVDKDYVKEPDKQKMLDAALTGMLSALDPHSSYFNEEDYDDFVNHIKGEFGGIGVEIVPDGGVIKIISPIDDLAADKAGIKAGDYIIAVGDDTVASLGFNKAVKKLRGDPGTKVKLSVLSEGASKAKDYELTREIVKIKAVKSKLDGDVAYLRLVTFNEHTISELKAAMKKILAEAKKPLKGMILDLRNNPGGPMDQAEFVSEYFINSGLIVTTEGRNGENKSSHSASKFVAKAPDLPMVALINGGSASSSEIVAGALQDHKRAVVLGTQSFGKGSVQLFTPMPGSTAIKITIAKYYTPNGREIQAKGITPDIIAEQAKVEYPKSNPEDKRFSEAALRNYLKGSEDDKQKDENKGDDKDDKNKNKQDIKGKDVDSKNSESKDKDLNNKKDTKNKKDKKGDAKDQEPEMSEMYKNDYQYSRAYDLILGIYLTNFAAKEDDKPRE